jgi:hypothetical protein
LIKFAKKILSALRSRKFQLYGHKFSKKTYTLHQHIILLSLREYQKGIGFRQFCKLLPDFSPLLDYIGLKKIPHFTTLHKVNCRLKGSLLEDLFLGFASNGKIHSGIDSTGLSLQHSTDYYEKRLEHFRKVKHRKPGRPRKRRRKKHQYTNIFVDLDLQIILSAKFARGSKSDSKMMIPTVKKSKELFDRIVSFDADKGYDAEYNHEYVYEIMKSSDFIKLKNKDVPIHDTKGTYRKKAKRRLKNKVGRPRKNHRNKAETIMFVVKKIFGEHITSIKAKCQRNQTRLRIIAYNAYRKVSYILLSISTRPPKRMWDRINLRASINCAILL